MSRLAGRWNERFTSNPRQLAKHITTCWWGKECAIFEMREIESVNNTLRNSIWCYHNIVKANMLRQESSAMPPELSRWCVKIQTGSCKCIEKRAKRIGGYTFLFSACLTPLEDKYPKTQTYRCNKTRIFVWGAKQRFFRGVVLCSLLMWHESTTLNAYYSEKGQARSLNS